MTPQLVIPMSGLGSRFAKQGYRDLKPLINVQGHPIIEWVLRMFPGINQPLFICRNDHLENTEMLSILQAVKPNGRIFGVEGAKLGPVGALISAFNVIDDDAPIIVSYCDYYMNWDFAAFLHLCDKNDYDGAIPCYTGFHPHLLPNKNLYASCQVNSSNELIEIREKFSFETNKKKALHSPGTYYFKSGRLLKQYCIALVKAKQSIGGEYYVSLVYNQMVADGLCVWAGANVDFFCQWGTPTDLEEYLYWTSLSQGKST